jgi:hypothetical protein
MNEIAGPYLSPETYGGDFGPVIDKHSKAPGCKSRTVEQCIYRCNALSLLKNQLLCLGVRVWNGEVTEIERVKVDHANMAQETALHLAVVRGDVASVKALLAAGACTEVKNSFAQTAVHLASEQGNEQLVQALLEANANPDAVDKEGKSCLEMAVVHNHSCSSALKRIGADGWTPLMVAAEKGEYAIEEYLLCRKYCFSLRNREPFPENFRHEVQFYSGLLPPKTSKFEWGRKWNMTIWENTCNWKVAAVDKFTVSCALGSDEFASGIHIWKVLMTDFQGKAWIGVARNSDDLACDPQTSKSSKTCYIVYFGSHGAEGVAGAHQQSKPVFFDSIGSSTFSSGQIVELRLDTFKNSLEMRLDGSTTKIAHNIDARNIYPYVCFENSGSAAFVECSSSLLSLLSVISEEERCAGCENSLWSSDLDNALSRCFKSGT